MEFIDSTEAVGLDEDIWTVEALDVEREEAELVGLVSLLGTGVPAAEVASDSLSPKNFRDSACLINPERNLSKLKV